MRLFWATLRRISACGHKNHSCTYENEPSFYAADAMKHLRLSLNAAERD